jgi:hypothetical protein
MAPETYERVITNCFACGKSMEEIRDMPRHTPEPRSGSDRCVSRPRKYSNLQCQWARDHECAHTARVAGTGLTFWTDAEAA